MTYDVVFILLLGGIWTAVTVEVLVRSRRIVISFLLFGAVFLALGVLGLRGLIAPESLPVIAFAGNGMLLIYGSYTWRGTPAHTNWPKWTGAAVIFGGGVGLILAALFSVLYMIYTGA